MDENDSSAVISEAQADFALKLLREVMSNDGDGDVGSTILSPTSVAIALAMCYAGAKDETAQEMGQLLANGVPEAKVHEYFGELLQAIQGGRDKNCKLEGANKLYIKSGFPILDAFKATIDRHYGGLFESVNFLEKAATAQKINDFMAQATHDKIKEVISEDMMDADTRLILVNAIYFKSKWANKFHPELTEKNEPSAFHISAGNQIKVDMMSNWFNVNPTFIFSEHPTFQVLGIPYKGECAHMFIVLPRERFGLGPVLAKLTGKELLELVRNRHKVEVVVELPKFKLESTHCLNEPLKRLGIARAFDIQKAQFNGMTAAAEQLLISQVVQKAFIDINEEGTDAGAPIWSNAPFCGEFPLDETPRFTADHPFAFFLVSSNGDNQQENSSSQTVVLFNGIYSG